ncbi:unnamed protein product [Phytophthora lilii]|uniref:Unnamed protein product n=1 Tax=Phytophthora lilii TaxID=2077276 RepID=A0A9W6TST3_9STRA|nr:unnamed protein product [Phytophthora lilii]
MQQLNGNGAGVGTSGLGTVASIDLGALGLGPLGMFFGSSCSSCPVILQFAVFPSRGMERLASGFSIGLAGWGNSTLPQSGFTLYLRVHSARNLAAVGRGSYCKLYLGNTEVVNGSAQAGASLSNLLADRPPGSQQQQQQFQPPTHRVFRTKVLYTDNKSCPEWNEKLELHVLNPETEILTIRVKNQLMLFCPAVGACAIPLRNIKMGEPAEQWFPLHKGGKPAGHIRLQLMLRQKDPSVAPPVAVNESPMQRLIQQHCQQERERRQGQQNEDAMRRRQFEEQERMQAELRRQKEEAQEQEHKRIEALAKMQAFQEQMQKEEHARVQAYLQKQMEHEEGWHADGLAEQMATMKVEDAPEGVTKDPNNGANFYFADDVVTASIRSSTTSSAGLKQTFTDSQGGSRREEVVEAVELSEAVLGEVVHDALPSSDSSSSGGDSKRRSKRHKERERWKQHSRRQSQSAKENQTRGSQPPLFPKFADTEFRDEVRQEKLSSTSLHSSDESDETSSAEEERRRRRRRRRRRKEKKARRKERRQRRKEKRRARRGSDGYESSSSSSSYSSSSSSSSSDSSSDERRKRKARKHKKTKERAQSQRERKPTAMTRAPAPPHSNSYGPDYSNYPAGSTDKYSQPPPPYAKPANSQAASPGYIETLPPQQQQKRSTSEMISTAADVASILSDVASIATSVQQLAGGGDAGGGSNGIPFAVPDMSQFLGGQDLSGLAGQDFSGLVNTDTTAQYF